MNLATVMGEIGTRLDASLTGVTVYRYPPNSVIPPAFVVSYPSSYVFDETYGRGMDRMSLPVVAVVGRPTDRATLDNLAKYAAGDGSESLKGILESGAYSTFDTIRVADIEFDVVTIGGTDFMAAIFNLEITGQGD